jgi:hypothetical protein
MWSARYVYTRVSSWNPNCKTLQSDWQQYDRPNACVIAQQYSSATFVSLHFHPHKEKFGACLNNFIIYFFFYFLKVRKFETAKREIA